MSYSQSKQDLFAELVNPKGERFFIDIGCSIPSFQSNTKLLLEHGWKGVGIDIQHRHKEWSEYPGMTFFQGDATKFNWDMVKLPIDIHYASVDVDIETLAALKNLLSDPYRRPYCLTVEHDSYRFGDQLRIPQREFMKEMGYILFAEDVKGGGFPYEDWYVHGAAFDSQEDRDYGVKVRREIEKWHA